MWKKRVIWVGSALLALTTVWIAFLRPLDEPKYHGRYLNEWLRLYVRYVSYQNAAEFAEAKDALQAIGTNALPHYLKWLGHEPRMWQSTVRNCLPSWIEKRKVVGDLLGDESNRQANYALWGIYSLGTNAICAIPTLDLMMKDRTKPVSAELAMRTLRFLGEPAIPAFQSALDNTNAPYRQSLIRWICVMAWELGRTNAIGPVLVAALHDHDPVVRNAAENCLRGMHERTLTNAPAQ